ncbi:Protein of unknown function [Pyronema omphalodes CBS 100304]|uniref:Uncharacterized protein n=1 Tax=Pyronema omphalodes (strain CBS 100304) TaxID=1076935 RepID=U4LSR9_PYROM|nr:Protein of unknown function [Pyronema omphalodes CBS 100304]
MIIGNPVVHDSIPITTAKNFSTTATDRILLRPPHAYFSCSASYANHGAFIRLLSKAYQRCTRGIPFCTRNYFTRFSLLVSLVLPTSASTYIAGGFRHPPRQYGMIVPHRRW